MKEYRVGVRPLRDGWWPDINVAKLTPKQFLELREVLEGREPFECPQEAVRFVSSTLGLANFP
jgi:hypothetical protein